MIIQRKLLSAKRERLVTSAKRDGPREEKIQQGERLPETCRFLGKFIAILSMAFLTHLFALKVVDLSGTVFLHDITN